MSNKELIKLAELIADNLFTDGTGEKAERLVMRSDTKNRYGGGWSKAGAVNQIFKTLWPVLRPESVGASK